MTKKEIAKEYIKFLSNGDVDKVVGLFAEKGKVHSPIYGENTAVNFYKTLSEDTIDSALKIKGIFEDSDTKNIAIYFEYTWTMKSNKIVTFDLVDIVEFNTQNEISKLKIIYDTVVSRSLVEEMKK